MPSILSDEFLSITRSQPSRVSAVSVLVVWMGKRCKNDEDGNRLSLLKVERLLLQNRSFRFPSCWQCVCLHNTPGCLLTQRSGICSRAAVPRARTYPFGLSLRARLVADKPPLCRCCTVKPLAGGFSAAAGSCLLRWTRGVICRMARNMPSCVERL